MVIEEYAVEGEGKASERLISMRVFELALPYRDAVPTHLCQLPLLFAVALHVSIYLLPPKIGVGLRKLKIFASFVAVPKAAVDKNAGAVLPQHQVGMTWEARVVETVAETKRPKPPPHNQFRARVFAADCRHVRVALGLRENIHNLHCFRQSERPFCIPSLSLGQSL